MSLFSFFKKKRYFTDDQQKLMVEAIKQAERNTSGEVRVFVEGRCKFVNAVDRAQEIFFGLKMDKTEDRNAVLLYIALDDHQLAIFADEGIYQRLGSQYWNDEVKKITSAFTKNDYTGGICTVVKDIGDASFEHFDLFG